MDEQTKTTMRTDKGLLIAEIERAGGTAKGSTVKCPFHEDRSASGGLYSDDEGVWRLKCHAASCGFNGDIFDVRERASGQSVKDQLRGPDAQPKRQGQKRYASIDAIRESFRSQFSIEDVYLYGKDSVQMGVIRLRQPNGKKTFFQFRPDGSGYVLEAPPKPWPIFGQKALADSELVVVVEGEKCVKALSNIGVVATTSPGGAGKAAMADWSPLAGKTVYLWPDNDPADPKTGKRGGIDHMRDVQKILMTLDPPTTLFWINPDDLNLPPKGDAADLMASVRPELWEDTIQNVLADAKPIGPTEDLRQHFLDIASGKWNIVSWDCDRLTRYTQALLPGTVTLICGQPGSAKSFFLLQQVIYWTEQGVKCAVFELEEDRKYHLKRALAQKTGNARLNEIGYVQEDPRYAIDAYNANRPWLDTLARCIHDAPDAMVTLSDLVAWTRARAAQGCRVIAIDPVTAAATSDKPWQDDQEFMVCVKTVARQYDCSIVLVTHPKKGSRGLSSLDDLAGGAAYQRFSQTVFWIEPHYPPKRVEIKEQMGGTSFVECNRTMYLAKTRNGTGGGYKLAYDFHGGTLKFEEKGLIQPND